MRDFLSYLATERKVSASTQNQAFNALLFMFRNGLGKNDFKIEDTVRAKVKKTHSGCVFPRRNRKDFCKDERNSSANGKINLRSRTSTKGMFAVTYRRCRY